MLGRAVETVGPKGGQRAVARRAITQLLLTSAGITNASIHHAPVDLPGQPIAGASALCVPTAVYAIPGGADHAWRSISGREPRCPVCELGRKPLGELELAALRSINRAHGVPVVQETDVLLVNGGDTLYPGYRMRQSGLADLWPPLRQLVHVGPSAGSLGMTPRIGADFVRGQPPTGEDEALGRVGFSIFPHLDHESMPDHCMAAAEGWAARMRVPGSAIDGQTAVRVTDGAVEVVSEGHWRLLPP